MTSKKITLRTGTYHTKMLNNDNVKLFYLLDSIYREGITGTIPGGDDLYRILYLRMAGDFLAANMIRIRKRDYAKVVPEGSNEIEKKEINSAIKGMVRFYMDLENNIFLEDLPPMIKHTKFAEILSNMIKTRFMSAEIYFSDPAITISFDRMKQHDVKDFLERVDVLNHVHIKVNTMDNPYRTNEQKTLARQFSEFGSDKTDMKSSKGMNKNTDMMGAIEGLTEDGHIDVRMSGRDKESEKIECVSNSKSDDSYEVQIENDEDINSFIRGISKIVKTVKNKRKSS